MYSYFAPGTVGFTASHVSVLELSVGSANLHCTTVPNPCHGTWFVSQ